MDYTGVIKRAWAIVWRYRILWLFGLLIGSSGGGGSGGSNYSFDSSDFDSYGVRPTAVSSWAESNWPLLLALLIFLLLVGLGFWIISIAAKGGLIHLVREADEERPVSGWNGWSVGWRYWGRVFLIELVLVVPFLVVTAVILVATIAPFMMGFVGDAAAPIAGVGACGVLAVGVPVLILGGLVIGILEMYATRFAVLLDVPSLRSVSEAWGLFRARFKETALMYLLTLAIGIAAGIGFAVVAGIMIAGGVFASLAMQSVVPGIIAFVVLMLILAVPMGIYSAFMSAIWTITFQSLTGAQGSAMARAQGSTASMPAPPVGMPPIPPVPPSDSTLPPMPPMPPSSQGGPIVDDTQR